MRFHHVGLSVADLDRAVAWYVDVAGMDEGFRFALPDGSLRGCFVAAEGAAVELLEARDSARAAGYADPPTAARHRGYGHMALTVADLEQTFARFVDGGARPVWDPRPAPEPGARMAWVADPDGNLIELIQPPEDILSEGKTA